GSLRDAIQSSHKGGIIKFDSSLSGQTIILNSELSITHNVKIQGLGSGNLTIDGNGQFRIFDISGASNVSLVGLTLADGLAGADSPNPSEGGAIYDDSGHLSLRDVTFLNDQAQGSDGKAGANGTDASGGAIFFAGKFLMVTNCTFTNDLAQGGNRGAG